MLTVIGVFLSWCVIVLWVEEKLFDGITDMLLVIGVQVEWEVGVFAGVCMFAC